MANCDILDHRCVARIVSPKHNNKLYILLVIVCSHVPVNEIKVEKGSKVSGLEKGVKFLKGAKFI